MKYRDEKVDFENFAIIVEEYQEIVQAKSNAARCFGVKNNKPNTSVFEFISLFQQT